MSALEQIVVTGCPTCGAPAQAIAEGEGVRYRHVDTATLKAAQGGVTEAMVEDRAREMYEAYRTANPDARMFPWEWQTFKPTRDHWRFKAIGALEAALSAEPAAQPEDSRCPPTYRREEAVKALIGKGWTWDGKAWAEPAAQGEVVAEVVEHEMDDGYLIPKRARLLRDLPAGTKLYTAPPAQLPEGWNPTDAEVREWLSRSDLDDDGRLEHWRTVIDDARSMHLLVPAPSEGGKGVEELAKAQALHAAVGAIYFSDGSDYLPALWTVVRYLAPDIVDELSSKPADVWNKTLAAVDDLTAAQQAAR